MIIINALYCISVPLSSDYQVRETLKFKLITKILKYIQHTKPQLK